MSCSSFIYFIILFAGAACPRAHALTSKNNVIVSLFIKTYAYSYLDFRGQSLG